MEETKEEDIGSARSNRSASGGIGPMKSIRGVSPRHKADISKMFHTHQDSNEKTNMVVQSKNMGKQFNEFVKLSDVNDIVLDNTVPLL